VKWRTIANYTDKEIYVNVSIFMSFRQFKLKDTFFANILYQ